jgi:hypothetical protein
MRGLGRHRPTLPNGLLTRRGSKSVRPALGSYPPGATLFRQLGCILTLIELRRRSK